MINTTSTFKFWLKRWNYDSQNYDINQNDEIISNNYNIKVIIMRY